MSKITSGGKYMKKATLCSMALLATVGLSGVASADSHVRQTLDVWGDFDGDGNYDPIVKAKAGDTLIGGYYAAIDDLDGGLQSYGVEVQFDQSHLNVSNLVSDPQWFLPETIDWDNAAGIASAFDGRIGGVGGFVHLFDVTYEVGRSDSSMVTMSDIFPGNAAFDGFVLADGTVLDGSLNYLPTAVVPEAETWAMMIIGAGMIGFAARRRQKAGALTTAS